VADSGETGLKVPPHFRRVDKRKAEGSMK